MRKAAPYGVVLVCICLVLARSGPSAQGTVSENRSGGTSATVTVGFVGVTTETFNTGVGALAVSRACYAEYPFTRLCEWADVFRSIPPPALDTDVLTAQNYGLSPRTTCITSDGGLRCRQGVLLPAACCGSIPSQILLNIDTTSSGCSSSTSIVSSCSQTICVDAQALDSSGKGIQGIVLLFKLQNNVFFGNTFNGAFTPSQAITNSVGKAFSMFTPDATCPVLCGGGKPCQAEMVVTALGGAQSSPLQLQINIP